MSEFKVQPHRFHKFRVLPWPVCECGLIYLKNPFTQWCVEHGCNHEEHPSYAAVKRKYTADQRAPA